MPITIPWVKSTLWMLRKETFTVQIKHHNDIGQSDTNQWSIYVYIYPDHRLFDTFEIGNHMLFQPCFADIPLHGGVTFVSWHIRDTNGTPNSLELGCDYNHLHDDHHRNMNEEDGNPEVFSDARRLILWLEAKNEEELS